MAKQEKGLIAKILHFITVEVWSINKKKISDKKFKWIRLLQIVILSGKGFLQKRCVEKASALTYYTVLSLVPLAAMAYGIAKGFGFDQYLEDYLISLFSDKQDIVDMILEFSESMLARTQGGLIAGVGIVVLLWSVIKVMSNIESAFNEIWSVDKQRTITRKLSDYITIVLLAPFCLIISYSVTSYITDWIAETALSVEWVNRFNGLISFGLNLLPYSLLWFAFALLYIVMPNTKVQFKAAFISGIITGIAFQIVQYFYFKFQIGVSNYNAIYGSFAAIPLFLVWLQMSWTIILVGAGMAYSIQNVKNFEYELEVTQLSTGLKTKLALLILHSITEQFKKELPPQTSLEISESIDLPHRITKMILTTMTNAGLIHEVKTDDEKTFAYAPAFRIDNMNIEHCIRRIQNAGINEIEFKDDETFHKISAIVDGFKIPENI
ncbi:MAG: YihY/virulence factor BrkB family protein, partial [Bacteroidales bacterium]|nr:YihY/virulence factor BrkB family protein [Bacteroidales bacterium]